jgi:nucleoid DNA-binding protein
MRNSIIRSQGNLDGCHINRLPFTQAQAVISCAPFPTSKPTLLRIATMNKTELITALAEQTGQTKAEVTGTLDALLETIGATLAQGDKLLLVGFGTFETQHRAARAGRNPQTGAAIEIAESTSPKFTPGKALKDRVAEAHKPNPPPPSAAAEARKPKPKATPPSKAKKQ